MDERLATRKSTLHSVTVCIRFYLHWMGDDMRCYCLTSYTLHKHFLSLLKLNDSNHRRPECSARCCRQYEISNITENISICCVWPVVLENATALKTPRLKTSICLYTVEHCFFFLYSLFLRFLCAYFAAFLLLFHSGFVHSRNQVRPGCPG